MRDSPSELHAAALEAMLEVAAADPPSFAGHYRHRVAWLQGFLGHVDATGDAQLFNVTATMPPLLLSVRFYDGDLHFLLQDCLEQLSHPQMSSAVGLWWHRLLKASFHFVSDLAGSHWASSACDWLTVVHARAIWWHSAHVNNLHTTMPGRCLWIVYQVRSLTLFVVVQ